MTAVVLAGGAPDAVAALAPGAPNKAFVPVGGIALVERTLRALRATPRVGRIIAVAPAAAHRDPALALADERRSDGPRMRDSLHAGLRGLDPDALVLVAASDLPVLTAAAIDEFLDGASACDADAIYGCLERRHHLARYPEFPHTWARLREGRFCGTGLVALRPRILPQLERVLDDLGAARKSPLRLAALLGWSALLRFTLGRLTIAEAEARGSAVLGARAAAVVCTRPEVAINVDRPADVARAERLVAQLDADPPRFPNRC